MSIKLCLEEDEVQILSEAIYDSIEFHANCLGGNLARNMDRSGELADHSMHLYHLVNILNEISGKDSIIAHEQLMPGTAYDSKVDKELEEFRRGTSTTTHNPKKKRKK